MTNNNTSHHLNFMDINDINLLMTYLKSISWYSIDCLGSKWQFISNPSLQLRVIYDNISHISSLYSDEYDMSCYNKGNYSFFCIDYESKH